MIIVHFIMLQTPSSTRFFTFATIQITLTVEIDLNRERQPQQRGQRQPKHQPQRLRHQPPSGMSVWSS